MGGVSGPVGPEALHGHFRDLAPRLNRRRVVVEPPMTLKLGYIYPREKTPREPLKNKLSVLLTHETERLSPPHGMDKIVVVDGAPGKNACILPFHPRLQLGQVG